MASDMVLYNDPLEGDVIPKAMELAKTLSNTEFVPSALRNKPAAVLAAILTGREIGVGPMASLAKIHVIEGRPALSAEMMRAIVLSHGHEIWFDDANTTRVTICGRRSGSERVTTVTWTMDDAKRAGLDAKQNWRRYPRAQLEARATSELCRMVFADVLGGISYSREELDDGIIDIEPADDPEPGDEAKPITRKAPAPRKTAAARKAAPAAAPAAAVAEPPLPPLPGEDDNEPVDAEIVEDEPGDAAAVKRAQQIAMRCNEAGLDDDGRHRLIEAVTNGVKSSAKTVTAEEGAEVLQAALDIANGRRLLVEGEDGWELVDVENPEPESFDEEEPEFGMEHTWSDEQWRTYLKRKGVRVPEVLKEAHRLCRLGGGLGEPPTQLADLHGNQSLCGLLRGYVEEQVEKAGGLL